MTKENSSWKINIMWFLMNNTGKSECRTTGPGFPKNELRISCRKKIEQINQTGVLPNSRIEWHGLDEYLLRLKLQYGGEHIFDPEKRRRARRRLVVTIGGWKENEYDQIFVLVVEDEKLIARNISPVFKELTAALRWLLSLLMERKRLPL